MKISLSNGNPLSEKEIQCILDSWIGEYVSSTKYIKSILSSEGIEIKDNFAIKKAMLGRLESNKNILQLMIATQLNAVHIFSSIIEIEYSKENETIVFYSQKNDTSIVSLTLMCANKGVEGFGKTIGM